MSDPLEVGLWTSPLMKRKPQGGGQRSGSSIDEEKRTELFSQLHALAWSADFMSRARRAVENSDEAERQIEELCSQHPFLARERSRMVKELQRTRVVVARRARRGEPLVPVKVIKANGRLREFGIKLRSGREPREATNQHRRGSARGARASSSSSDDPGDPDPDGDQNPLAVGKSAGTGAMSAPLERLCRRCRRHFIPSWGGRLCPNCSRRVGRSDAQAERQLSFAGASVGGIAGG